MLAWHGTLGKLTLPNGLLVFVKHRFGVGAISQLKIRCSCLAQTFRCGSQYHADVLRALRHRRHMARVRCATDSGTGTSTFAIVAVRRCRFPSAQNLLLASSAVIRPRVGQSTQSGHAGPDRAEAAAETAASSAAVHRGARLALVCDKQRGARTRQTCYQENRSPTFWPMY